MTIERGLRLMAGVFVLLSSAVGCWVYPYWYSGGVSLLNVDFNRDAQLIRQQLTVVQSEYLEVIGVRA